MKASQPMAPPSPSRRRLGVAALVLLLAVGGGAIWWSKVQERRQEAAKLQRTPLPRRIAALGRVEPLDRVVNLSVPNSLSNDAVRELLVKEATRCVRANRWPFLKVSTV